MTLEISFGGGLLLARKRKDCGTSLRLTEGEENRGMQFACREVMKKVNRGKNQPKKGISERNEEKGWAGGGSTSLELSG